MSDLSVVSTGTGSSVGLLRGPAEITAAHARERALDCGVPPSVESDEKIGGGATPKRAAPDGEDLIPPMACWIRDLARPGHLPNTRGSGCYLNDNPPRGSRQETGSPLNTISDHELLVRRMLTAGVGPTDPASWEQRPDAGAASGSVGCCGIGVHERGDRDMTHRAVPVVSAVWLDHRDHRGLARSPAGQ